MQKVDQATVRALELRAPGASVCDARIIEGQLRGAQIFTEFSEQDRARIFSRLRLSKGLIPSLYTFFRNIPYCELCVESMKHLTLLSRGDTIFTALDRHFTGLNQQDGQVVIQVSETDFTAVPGSLNDQVDLGYRQLFAFAMRHFYEIPQEKVDEDGLVMPRAKADRAVLRQYAGLANRLGFESTEIQQLLEDFDVMDSQAGRESTSPLLVTSGPGEEMRRRCGLPVLRAFEEDRDFLFVRHLHDQRDEQGEGITSFFVRRSVYLGFFGPPRDINENAARGHMGSFPILEDSVEREQGDRAQREEEERAQREQEEQAQTQREQQAQRERAEQERAQRERQEQLQQERAEQQRAQRERQEQLQQEREEQAQRERAEQAQRERAEQAQKERAEQVQREQAEQLQQERAEQLQQERAEELQRERAEQVQREREERAQREREEQLQQERAEQAQREREEQLQREREEQLQRERAEQAQLEREEQLQRERAEQAQREQEDQAQRERERQASQAENKVQIRFKIRERGVWRDVETLSVDRSDPSEVARVAKKNTRKGLRTFDTNAQLLGPDDCFEAVTSDGTNTILLIPQNELNIDDRLLDSASVVSSRAREEVEDSQAKRQAR